MKKADTNTDHLINNTDQPQMSSAVQYRYLDTNTSTNTDTNTDHLNDNTDQPQMNRNHSLFCCCVESYSDFDARTKVTVCLNQEMRKKLISPCRAVLHCSPILNYTSLQVTSQTPFEVAFWGG